MVYYNKNIQFSLMPRSFNSIFNYLKKYKILTSFNCHSLMDVTHHDFLHSKLHRYLKKHGVNCDFAHEHWYLCGDFNYIYMISAYKEDGCITPFVASTDADQIAKQARKKYCASLMKNIKKNNIIVPDSDKDYDQNFKDLINVGLIRSLRKKRNIILVESPNSFIESSKDMVSHFIDAMHSNNGVPMKTLKQYHVYHDTVNKTEFLNARDLLDICRYPEKLFSHQPFVLILEDHNDKGYEPGRGVSIHTNWDDYFSFTFDQIMYYLTMFPHANKYGLDILIYNLLRVPVIHKLTKYMRDTPLINCRFLIGESDHLMQQFYDWDDGYNGRYVNGRYCYGDHASMTFFRFSTSLPLLTANARYEHKKLPKLKDFW